MATIAKATPLPWHTEGIANPMTNPRVSLWGPREDGAQSGEWIAKDLRPENAAFILKAVHCHADLLAALKLAQAWLANSVPLVHDGTPPLPVIAAAIAKAEGR